MANFNRYAKLNRVLWYNVFAFIAFVLLLSSPFYLQDIADMLLSKNHSETLLYDSIQGKVGDRLRENAISPYYTLFEATQKEFLPYEDLIFNFSIIDKDTGKVLKQVSPTVTLKDKDGNKLSNIFNNHKIQMDFSEENNYFTVSIHLKDPTYVGRVDVYVSVKDRLYRITKESISINIKKHVPTFQFPNTYTFLGFDSKDTIALRNILSVDGKETSVDQLSKWFRVLNNDAVIMPSSITKVQNKSSVDAWDMDKLKESKNFAKEFSRHGVDVALWIQALEIDGKIHDTTSYVLSIPENKNTDSKNDVISLTDTRRKKELIEILKDHMNDPNIAYVGFSKIFFHHMNQELYEQFLLEHGDHYSEHTVKRAFDKWKNIQLVQYYRSIFSYVEKKKPIFIMFDGKEIIDNPDYIGMAYSAGADFVIVDLDASLNDFAKQWEYITKNSVIDQYMPYTVLSYCLNYKNIASSRGSVIDNWIEANLLLFNKYNIQAIRINDFYRAMFGERGPYSSYEWILSIGELISRWKKSRSYYPLTTSYTASSGEISNNITVNMELHNSSSVPLTDITLRLLLVSNNNQTIFKYPVIYPQETIRTSISLSYDDLYKSLVQKKTKFLGLHTEFTKSFPKKEHSSQLGLISFLDPKILEDPVYSTEDISEVEKKYEYENFLTDFSFLDQLSHEVPKQEITNNLSYLQIKSKKTHNLITKKKVVKASVVVESPVLEVINEILPDPKMEKTKKERLKRERKEKKEKTK